MRYQVIETVVEQNGTERVSTVDTFYTQTDARVYAGMRNRLDGLKTQTFFRGYDVIPATP